MSIRSRIIKNGGVKMGEKCGKKCEVYSRVVGYYRPIENWNDGKQEEFSQRKYYNTERIIGK